MIHGGASKHILKEWWSIAINNAKAEDDKMKANQTILFEDRSFNFAVWRTVCAEKEDKSFWENMAQTCQQCISKTVYFVCGDEVTRGTYICSRHRAMFLDYYLHYIRVCVCVCVCGGSKKYTLLIKYLGSLLPPLNE